MYHKNGVKLQRNSAQGRWPLYHLWLWGSHQLQTRLRGEHEQRLWWGCKFQSEERRKVSKVDVEDGVKGDFAEYSRILLSLSSDLSWHFLPYSFIFLVFSLVLFNFVCVACIFTKWFVINSVSCTAYLKMLSTALRKVLCTLQVHYRWHSNCWCSPVIQTTFASKTESYIGKCPK